MLWCADKVIMFDPSSSVILKYTPRLQIHANYHKIIFGIYDQIKNDRITLAEHMKSDTAGHICTWKVTFGIDVSSLVFCRKWRKDFQ